MRVVVIGHRHLHCAKDRIIGGGGETFERDLLRHLGGTDNEVIWLTQDSEELEIPGVTQINLPIPNSMGMTKGKRAAQTRRRNNYLSEYLHELEADFFFNNDDSNVGMCRILIEIGVPSVTFHHAAWKESGFRNLMGILPMYKGLVDGGHSVSTVSKANRDKYNEDLLGRGKFFDEFIEELRKSPDTFINEYIHPFTIWEKPKAQPSNGRFSLLTRMSDGKNFKFILDIAKERKYPIYWFAPTPIQPRDIAIKDRVLKSFPNENVVWDLPRDQLLDEIGKVEAIIVTGYEAAPISAFEANANGVPVVLVTDIIGHPCTETCKVGAEGDLYEVLFSNKEERVTKLEELFSNWAPKTLSERQAILDATWEKYNPEATRNRTMALMGRTIERVHRISGPPERRAPSENIISMFGVPNA